MKTKEEILDKIIADEGLKFWEAHTDNFNRKIAMKAMDIFASQSPSSKIEEVREKMADEVLLQNYAEINYLDKDQVSTLLRFTKYMRKELFILLEGEKG